MLSALMRVPRDLIGLCYAAAVHTVTVPPGINLIGLQALVDSPEVHPGALLLIQTDEHGMRRVIFSITRTYH